MTKSLVPLQQIDVAGPGGWVEGRCQHDPALASNGRWVLEPQTVIIMPTPFMAGCHPEGLGYPWESVR